MVQFNATFFNYLQTWGIWAVYNIAYRGVFGLWTSKQQQFYTKVRQRMSWGLPVWFVGSYRLIMVPWVALGMSWYQMEFESCNALGIYASTLVMAWVSLIFDLIWEELMYDRRDSTAALRVTQLSIPSHVAWIVLLVFNSDCGQGWVRWMVLPAAAIRLVYALYHMTGMWIWTQDPQLEVNAKSRKEQRERKDIEKPIRASLVHRSSVFK